MLGTSGSVIEKQERRLVAAVDPLVVDVRAETADGTGVIVGTAELPAV